VLQDSLKPKYSAIGRVLRDVVFVSIIVVLIGCVLLLESHVGVDKAGGANLWSEIERDFGIILCSIGLISILYEMLIRRQLIADYSNALRDIIDPDTRRLGVSALFENRDDKTHRGRSIDALLRSTNKELLCVGLGFYQFLPEKRDLLLAKLREGCTFRFLIFDAGSETARALDKSLGYGNGSLVAFLHAQQNYFVEFLTLLEKEGVLKERFEVRVYDVVPTFGALHLDPKSARGRLIIELFGHRVEGAICPGVELMNLGSGWYTFYERQISELWDASPPLAAGPAARASGLPPRG
jgi:hypothetical protein